MGQNCDKLEDREDEPEFKQIQCHYLLSKKDKNNKQQNRTTQSEEEYQKKQSQLQEQIKSVQQISPSNPQKQVVNKQKQIRKPREDQLKTNHSKPKIKLAPQVIQKCNKGMENIGNTCYLNSALQSLYQTQYLNKQLTKRGSVINGVKKNKFTQQYNLMCLDLQNKKKAFKPSKIKSIIEQQNSRFRGYKQQDSGQVVNNILNILDEQTNIVQKVKINRIQYDYKESDESLFAKYSKKHMEMCFSVLDKVFTGYFKTAYKCQNCSSTKRLFEKFTMVYLPITKKITILQKLQDCIKEFTQEQELDWDCLNCKTETPHKKTMQIYKANKTIIFCLKRFNQDNSKINNSLKIPIQLNLNQYIRLDQQYSHKVSERKYQLYAAIIHRGNYDSGHYYAVCYDYRAQCWAQYNDKSVRPLIQEQVLSLIQKAYVLFYRMQSCEN